MPSEAALVRQPSVAAAVHQALPDMPVPPLTLPLSNTSSESRDPPEGLLLHNPHHNSSHIALWSPQPIEVLINCKHHACSSSTSGP